MGRYDMKPVLKQNPNRKQTLLLLSALLMLLFLSNIQCTREIDTNSLIRIHVLASSNSDTDQQLKLKVKDDVIRYLQLALKQSDSLAESRRIILSSLPQIEQTALQTLQQNGCEDTVTLQYGHFDFPVKYYGSFSLPAGNYEALRILIGEGKGRNWWCVLFPPLCFTDSNVSSSGKYTDQTPDTHIQFKLKSIEWLKSLQNKENDLAEGSERP
ncbi:MAG: stage II sporulation protein R [Peptococcaceae bacterium]|nr:stage II sporulation protein R [Peptococcaceae bacterium]